jgi:MFS family permease
MPTLYIVLIIGTLVAFPVSGALLSVKLLDGWPFIFYLFGSIGVLWFIVWAFLVFESPMQNPYISIEVSQPY